MAPSKPKLGRATMQPPSIPPDHALNLLNRQKAKAEELLKQQNVSEDDIIAWRSTTTEVVIRAFGSHSRNVDEITAIIDIIYDHTTEHQAEMSRRENLSRSIKVLESCIEQLEMFNPPAESKQVPMEKPTTSLDVFVVHGREESKREAVARFLEKLNLRPVILHEQPSLGRTLIEKLEGQASVGFAVVILTGDDRGGPIEQATDAVQPRARQNVVFEHGYFIGRLGRKRVCALYQEGVELPSDFAGVVYIPLDNGGGWRILLARELKEAGLPIDLNLAM